MLDTTKLRTPYLVIIALHHSFVYSWLLLFYEQDHTVLSNSIRQTKEKWVWSILAGHNDFRLGQVSNNDLTQALLSDIRMR